MPTFVHGKNAKVLVGSYDLTTNFKEYSASTAMDMAETSAFGNSYKTYVQGLGEATISLSGMWSGETGEVDDVLGGAIGNAATLPVTICPNGYGIGNKGFGIGAQEASYEITASIGDVVAVAAEFQSTVNTGGRSGVLLTSGASVSATTTGSAVNGSAASTAGGYALLHVTANTRNATVIVTIEDSADGSTGWATIATFGTVTAASLDNEYLAISGTIRQYTRAVVTLTAGTGAVTSHVLLVRL
jgi:hypothetical protein